jgi:3-oxoacid CoA-transferase B subunit
VSADVQARIAARVARLLRPGEVVNLGIGIPTLVAGELEHNGTVILQSENGMLGVGPRPPAGREDPDLIDAGKLPVSELPGACYFSSSESFAMIRGGHIDVAVLGTLQVDSAGRIANWSLPGRPIMGVGGAMDLVAGAKRVIVATTHLAKDGQPKLVAACTYPLTGERCADVVVTEHATFERRERHLVCVNVAKGTTHEWLRAHTEAAFEFRCSEDPAAA